LERFALEGWRTSTTYALERIVSRRIQIVCDLEDGS
jgi:hypothetical protein